MDDQEFDLRSIMGLLRRQARLIIATVVLIVAVAGGAILTLKPVYTAATLVLVDPSQKDLLNPDSQSSSSSSDSARVESEVELVKSQTTLLRAIRDNDLLEDPEFGVSIGLRDRILSFLRLAQPELPTGESALQGVILKLRDALSVQRLGLTYLISVEVSAYDPARAAAVANAVAGAYIRQQLEAKIDGILASRDIIQNRIAEAGEALVASENAFDTFIAANIDAVSADTGRADLLALRQQLERVGASRTEATSLSEMAARSLEQRDWTRVAEQLESQALANLARERDLLEASLRGEVQQSQDEATLRAELRQLEAELERTAATELNSLRQEIAAAQTEMSNLRTQLRSSVLQSDLPATVLASIYELQQNAEIARTQYQSLLARQQDLNTQASLQVADSRIASAALPPIEPSFPNPRLILMLAVAAALGIGIGLAFLVENYVGGFTSEGQLQSVLRTGVVAAVPKQRVSRRVVGKNTAGLADYVSEAPLSVFSESIRRLQIGLNQALRRTSRRKEGGAIVMVASAAPNEGKSTIALSLARSYALAGKSTLLIDCDLRKPSIHRQLGLEPSDGLLEYLATPEDGPSLSSIMTVDAASGAQVVVGARRSDIATDQLVSGATFTRLVSAARKSFDVLVLDTPPVGPVVDGLYLAELADVILLVVRWANTSQQDTRSAVAALTEAKRDEVEIVAVLNQQEETKMAYRNKYAGYYQEV